MTDGKPLSFALEKISVTFERLYRVDVERAVDAPGVLASRPPSLTIGRRPVRVSWEPVVMLYDVYNRTLPQILAEIAAMLKGATGRHRLRVFYWSGTLVKPPSLRLMGNGENFQHSPNPRGDLVIEADPIEFVL